MDALDRPAEIGPGRMKIANGTSCCLILAGPFAAGKTTLARALAVELGVDVVAAREILRRGVGRHAQREELQNWGRRLEERTAGSWMADAVAHVRANRTCGFVIDALRTPRQVAEVQRLFEGEAVTLFLTADRVERCRRFTTRAFADSFDALTTFDLVENHPTENVVFDLEARADLVMDSTSMAAEQVAKLTLALLADR
jgi:cytidylate kinase